jgi:hypothetical protein
VKPNRVGGRDHESVVDEIKWGRKHLGPGRGVKVEGGRLDDM